MTDEFDIYDTCTADSLEKNDLIEYNGNYIQVLSVEDKNNLIEVSGLDLSWEEEIEFAVDPYEEINLVKFRD